jgi:hypothetical protein
MRTNYSIAREEQQALKVREYIRSHPNSNLKAIIQNCGVTRYRLDYLYRTGQIKLPMPTPFGERNGLFRKSS